MAFKDHISKLSKTITRPFSKKSSTGTETSASSLSARRSVRIAAKKLLSSRKSDTSPATKASATARQAKKYTRRAGKKLPDAGNPFLTSMTRPVKEGEKLLAEIAWAWQDKHASTDGSGVVGKVSQAWAFRMTEASKSDPAFIVPYPASSLTGTTNHNCFGDAYKHLLASGEASKSESRVALNATPLSLSANVDKPSPFDPSSIFDALSRRVESHRLSQSKLAEAPKDHHFGFPSSKIDHNLIHATPESAVLGLSLPSAHIEYSQPSSTGPSSPVHSKKRSFESERDDGSAFDIREHKPRQKVAKVFHATVKDRYQGDNGVEEDGRFEVVVDAEGEEEMEY